MKKRTDKLLESIKRSVPEINITNDTFFVDVMDCLTNDEFRKMIDCFIEFKK